MFGVSGVVLYVILELKYAQFPLIFEKPDLNIFSCDAYSVILVLVWVIQGRWELHCFEVLCFILQALS